VPYFALAALGLAVVLALYVRKTLWQSAIAALVLAPMRATFSSSPAQTHSAAMISQAIEAGDPQRQVAIILLLLVGLALLVHRPREPRRVNLLIWLTLYVTIAVASLLWSQDRLLTLRSSIVALSVIVFSLGIGSVHYGRHPQGHIQLVKAVCWTSTAASILTLFLALYRGNMHVLDFAWRLGSAGHENQISEVAAVGLLAAVLTRHSRTTWPSRLQILLVMAVPALVVVLTKSRTTWLGLMAGILVIELYKRRSTGARLAIILIMGIALGIVTSLPSFQSLWTRGDPGQTQTLSGRTALWKAIWPDVSKRLWLGYGYHAFWTPSNVTQIGGWVPTSAHSGYLEIVAQLGLIGLGVTMVLVVVSLRNAWRLAKHRDWQDIGLYLLALTSMALVIGATSSFIEEIENYPIIVLLTVMVFVSHRISVLKAARTIRYAHTGRSGRAQHLHLLGSFPR